MPELHDALAAGQVSAAHVDAVARTAAELDDAGRAELRRLADSLVVSATALPVETFECECRGLARILTRDDGVSRLARLKAQRRVRRWVDRQTGMCNTMLQLDPEADARVWTGINAALASERAKPQDADTNWDHLAADAVVNLITGAQSLDARVPEVSVLIDLSTLRDGLHDHSVCETADGAPLPPETIRRLCCDADIIPVVLSGHREALDVGRQQRLANRQQRRALRAMYRTCGHPGCTVAFEQCRIHHVMEWDHRGPTDLANLLPLCRLHHHLVHEGGWSLTIDPDRTITLRRPDGTLHFRGTTVDRTRAVQAAATPTAATADDHTPRPDRPPTGAATVAEAATRPPAIAEPDPPTTTAPTADIREPEPAADQDTDEQEPTRAPGPRGEPLATAGAGGFQLALAVDSGTNTPCRSRPPPRAPAA